MSADLRGHTVRLLLNVDLITETCFSCNVLFAMTAEQNKRLRANPGTSFFCPNGHEQHYTGPSAAEKLRRAEARETALRDQLEASTREADATRAAHLRDRQRIANGVCPCCNRSFENVRRHMTGEHPDYVAQNGTPAAAPAFECGCGQAFDTYRGLRTHQGKARPANWAKPGQESWRSHLTVGVSR